MRFDIANRTRQFRADPDSPLIVRAVDDFPACLGAKLTVNRVDGREILVVVKMLFLDVQHDRVLWMIKRERSVTFISLRHEKIARRIPMRIGPKDGNLGSNIVRGMQSADSQDVSAHRRSRGFAVPSAYDDALLAMHNCRESVRAAYHVASALLRFVILRIPKANGGRIDDEIHAGHICGVVSVMEKQSERLQSCSLNGRRFV